MLRTRERKILRDVWSRKGRTLMVSIAIFIGVIGTIALFSMSDIIVSQLEQDVQQEKLAMLEVSVEVDPGEPVDNAQVLQTISQYLGVTAVMGGSEGDQGTSVSFKTAGGEKFEEVYLQTTSIWNGDAANPQLVEVFDKAPLEPLRVLSEGSRNEKDGRLPQAGQNELMIERRMAEEYDLKVGDIITVRVPSPSRSSDPAISGRIGTEEEWTITAIVFDPYSLEPKLAGYTTLDNTNYLAGSTGFTQFWIRFRDYPMAEASKKDLQDYIATNTPYIPRFVVAEDPAQSSLIQGALILGNLMSFLALVALVVSGFLVINVITSLVVEQKRQIGVLKTLGASRGDAFMLYSGIAFMYGLIAVVPGVILGIPAGNAAAHALAPEVNSVVEGFKISPSSIILGITVGLLVPVVASLWPVFNGTRVRILEAMTDLGIDARYGSGPLARVIGKLPIPITIRQGLSNVSIKKGRLMFTVLTLAVAVGAFMGIFAIFESMRGGIQSYIDTFNCQVGIAARQVEDPAQFEAALRASVGEENIKSFEEGFFLQAEFKGYEPEVTAFGPPGIFAFGYNVESSAEDRAFQFTIDEGEDLTVKTAREDRPRGVIFSSALAINMDKEVGDIVTLKVPGKEEDLKIVGISKFPIPQLWLDWMVLAEIADYNFTTITGGSPFNTMFFEQMPPEAAGFVESLVAYASMTKVDGTPVMTMGFTPGAAEYLQFDPAVGGGGGQFFSSAQPGVVISKALADARGYTLGQDLTLASTVSDNSQTYPIVGIFASLLPTSGEAETAPAGAPGMDALVGLLWSDLVALDGAQVNSEIRPQLYFINTPDDEVSAKEIDNLVEQVNSTMVQAGMPIFALNLVDLTEQITTGFFTIQAILSAVAGLIALVGALGLLTTLSMAVFERQKEIGVMRSIGASSRIVATQFLTEGVVTGVIAWLVGLPIMILLQYLLIQIVGAELFPLEVSPTAIVIGFIGMMIITTIASLWPSLGAARKTVSDILRYQ